jgi:hypothetical protein
MLYRTHVHTPMLYAGFKYREARLRVRGVNYAEDWTCLVGGTRPAERKREGKYAERSSSERERGGGANEGVEREKEDGMSLWHLDARSLPSLSYTA